MAIITTQCKALMDERWSGSLRARSCRYARNENRVPSATPQWALLESKTAFVVATINS